MAIFVTKGDSPLTEAQLEKRSQRHIARDWPAQARERSIRKADGLFDTFMTAFSADHDINVLNNTFNWQLAKYREATTRLEKYSLIDGRPEQIIKISTGQYDEEGNEIMDITVIPAIDPLEAQVEQTVYDDEGNVTTIIIDNPLIVVDNAERAAAQAVVDITPDEVKNFSY